MVSLFIPHTFLLKFIVPPSVLHRPKTQENLKDSDPYQITPVRSTKIQNLRQLLLISYHPVKSRKAGAIQPHLNKKNTNPYTRSSLLIE